MHTLRLNRTPTFFLGIDFKYSESTGYLAPSRCAIAAAFSGLLSVINFKLLQNLFSNFGTHPKSLKLRGSSFIDLHIVCTDLSSDISNSLSSWESTLHELVCFIVSPYTSTSCLSLARGLLDRAHLSSFNVIPYDPWLEVGIPESADSHIEDVSRQSLAQLWSYQERPLLDLP